MIWRYYCLEEMSGVITLRSTTNLMEPGKQYLICLEENPLNEKTKTKNFPVSFSSGLIPADGTKVEALPKGMRTADSGICGIPPICRPRRRSLRR